MSAWWKRFVAFFRKERKPHCKIVADPAVFCFQQGSEILWSLRWEQVQKVEAYKADLFTIDQLRLAFHSEDGRVYVLDEDLCGFEDLLAQMMCALPTIESNWRMKVLFPAFKENCTVIYHKNS